MSDNSAELPACLASEWEFVEATLEELLADDVLQQAVRSAGLTPKRFRDLLRRSANRMQRPMN
jgi:hypothetical protein